MREKNKEVYRLQPSAHCKKSMTNIKLMRTTYAVRNMKYSYNL
jgi:hypothetical protein